MWFPVLDIAPGPYLDDSPGSYAPLIVIILLAVVIAVGLVLVLRAVRKR